MRCLPASLLVALAMTTARAEPADSIFFNGNVYTVNRKQPHAEAIAVERERTAFVGSNTDAEKFRGKNTRVIDLRGRAVFPGFTDSHCHIFGIGEREINFNLEGTNTLEDLLTKVQERVSKTESGKWITGRGWIETFWKPPQFPTRADLDKIAPRDPVFLTRADGHAAIANSAALKIAGITRDTPDPFGGEILKDKTSGEPTGMLLDNAMDLINIPPPTEAEREHAFLAGVDREIKLGWCEIQNAGSELADQTSIRRAFDAGKIKLRVINAAWGPGEAAQKLLQDGPILNAYGHRFTQRTIKVIFDGALGSRGAALRVPYSDKPDTSGYLTQKPEDLRPMFKEALRRGIQVETHAIGDRANRLILDLYEEAMLSFLDNKYAVPGPRWRVEHAQILSEQDIPRFAKLGVIASMQPSHAISDLFFAPARLGMDRLRGAYAWNSLIKSGAIICGGSDAPVERGEPMIEFYAAVTRRPLPEHGLSVRAPSGVELRSPNKDKDSGQDIRWPHRQDAYVPPPGEGWHPEQAVSREQALRMFTINAAYAAFE